MVPDAGIGGILSINCCGQQSGGGENQEDLQICCIFPACALLGMYQEPLMHTIVSFLEVWLCGHGACMRMGWKTQKVPRKLKKKGGLQTLGAKRKIKSKNTQHRHQASSRIYYMQIIWYACIGER